MKILAISGLILVGATAVVTAAPAKEETAERVSHTREKEANAQDDRDWVELASPTQASHGRTFITVDGRYAQLRIDAHQGHPHVKTVRIVYADGKQRVVKINRALAGNRPTALVDVDPRGAIDHVVIETDRRSKATYTVAAAGAIGVATR